MSNVILPTLYTLGVDQFNQEYNYTNVLRYILSSLLKSSLTTSKELAEYLDTSVRQAQRYIFNNFKADKGYHNLKIELEQLQDIMHQVSWYKLLIPEHKVNFSQFSNTFIWQELVITLLKKYIEQFYLFYKNKTLDLIMKE